MLVPVPKFPNRNREDKNVFCKLVGLKLGDAFSALSNM